MRSTRKRTTLICLCWHSARPSSEPGLRGSGKESIFKDQRVTDAGQANPNLCCQRGFLESKGARAWLRRLSSQRVALFAPSKPNEKRPRYIRAPQTLTLGQMGEGGCKERQEASDCRDQSATRESSGREVSTRGQAPQPLAARTVFTRPARLLCGGPTCLATAQGQRVTPEEPACSPGPKGEDERCVKPARETPSP